MKLFFPASGAHPPAPAPGAREKLSASGYGESREGCVRRTHVDEAAWVIASSRRRRAALRARRSSSRVSELEGPRLRHAEGLHANRYYNDAVAHTKTGTRFTIWHDGEFRNAYITRIG